MNLPGDFIRTITATFGKDGIRWLEQLPSLVNLCSTRWRLSGIQPVSNLSYNFAAFAKRESEDVVLKIGVPNRELTSEMSALKYFNGVGACRLLEYDEQNGALLLERLRPGMMLSELNDDDERTRIAAEVLLGMKFPVPDTPERFIYLSGWFAALKDIRPQFGGGTGPFDENILRRVESELPRMFEEESVLLHGDFHHFNILSSERGWLMIDPKGVIGPRGYEIGPFMLNPNNEPMDGYRLKSRIERRVDIYAEMLGWERESILRWSLAHAILSAWWNLEAGLEADRDLSAAWIFHELKK